MNRVPKLTAKRLRSLLHYCKATGVFTWKVSRGNVAAGARAGSLMVAEGVEPRWRIFVDNRPYLAHRLAWLWVKGQDRDTMEIVPVQIDHRDMDGANNRWRNLRAATPAQNQANTRARHHNRCGLKWVRTRYYRSGAVAYQAVVGQTVYGTFPTPEAAHAVARAKARQKHGAFFNPGAPRNARRNVPAATAHNRAR